MSAGTDFAQACGSLIQAGCALLGLVGLGVYAWDTREIRNATLAQADAARRPFFNFKVITRVVNGTDGQPIPILKVNARNVGAGHAIDVVVLTGKGKPVGVVSDGFVVAIGKNMNLKYGLLQETTLWLYTVDGLRIEYSDTAGKRYWSSVKPASSHAGQPIESHYVTASGEMGKTRSHSRSR